MDVTQRNLGYEVFAQQSLSGEQIVKVNAIKDKAAYLWNEINEIGIPPGNTSVGRLVSLAKTDLESSVMWAIKALSRQ